MKKILAAALVLVLAICFAACGKRNDPQTDDSTLSGSLQDPLNAQTQEQPSDMAAVSGESGSNTTMILTTQRGQTMPTVSTTAFVPQPATTQNAGTSLTVPTMSAPTVVTSNQPYTYSTVPGGGTVPAYITTSRVVPTFTTTTGVSPYTAVTPAVPTVTNSPTSTSAAPTFSTATQPTTAPSTTKNVTRRSKTVVINDYATTSDKKLVVTIDPSGWDGSFQNNSQNITVKVDGSNRTAMASVKSSAKNADGYQYITIDLSELSVPEGANVQFTIPSAFLQTASGAQYNSAFSGAYTMM